MSGSIFLESSSYSALEQSGTVTVTFKRTGDTSQPVNISYGINPLTAEDGADYTGVDGVAQIAAGEETVRIEIPILDDALGEPTESFNVSIISVDSGRLLFPRTAIVNILDDETPTVDPTDPPLESDYETELTDVVTGLRDPIGITWMPGSDSQAIVVELSGRLRIVNTESGEIQSTLLDIRDETNSNADRGLMDIALHPDFDTNPYLYAFYVVDPEGSAEGTDGQRPDAEGNRYAHVVKYELNTDGPLPTIVEGSKEILLGTAGQSFADISGEGRLNYTEPQYADRLSSERDPETGEFKTDYIKVDAQSHAGGALAFGPDGNLYVSIGDGTSFNFSDPRSIDVQNPDSLSGKILRVDPLTGQGLADNPFAGPEADLSANRSKVFQLGLRNPYSMTFTEDGDLFISETGWTSYEEINSGPAGANFGWPFYEGGDAGVLVPTPGYRNSAGADEFYAAVDAGTIVVTPPYRAFSQNERDPGFEFQAIVGASSIYNGDKYPAEFLDDYFFTDIPNGQIFAVDTNDRTELKYVTSVPGYGPTNFVQGPDGYIYLTDIVNGNVKRLEITDPNTPTNEAPVLDLPLDEQSASVGAAFTFQVPAETFTDPDDDTLVLSAESEDGSALPGWLTFNAETGEFSGTPLATDVGTVTIRLLASDPSGETTSDVFSLNVGGANVRPVVADALDAQTVNAGNSITFAVPQGAFTDANGDTLTYTATRADGSPLPTWLTFDGTTGAFSGTPSNDNAGRLVVTVTASDPSGASTSDSFLLTVEPTDPVNTPPVVAIEIPDLVVDEEQAIDYAIPAGTFTDADNDELTLSATLEDGSALPTWLSFDPSTGRFTGTPDDAQVGSLDVAVTASDGNGGTVRDVFSLTVNAVNDAPTVATELLDQSGQVGTAFSLVVPATTFTDVDDDDALLTLAATRPDGTALPDWLTFDEMTNTFSGTPPVGSEGTLDVMVTASDPGGLTVSDQFTLTIAEADPQNTAPVIAVPITDVIVDEEAALDVTLPAGTFTDADGDELTLAATLADGSALPTWLSFDATAGRFTGNPDDPQVDTIQVTVTASDGRGGTVSDTFDLTVNPVNDAPTVATPIADQSGQVGAAFSFLVPATSFTDVDDDDALLTLSASGPQGAALPTWLTFDPLTATFSGTPAEGDEGTVDVVVTARDVAGLEVSDQFTLTIAEAPPVNNPPVIGFDVPDFTINEEEPVDYTIPGNTFIDPDGDTMFLTATQEDGSPLPDWLNFDPVAGRFWGTPDDADVGTFTVALTASDRRGGSVTEFSTITVNPVNDAPTLDNPLEDQSPAAGADIAFTIPGTTFSDVDDAVLTLAATQVGGAALPSWLNFNATDGSFSGTPPTDFAGTLEIEVTAEDAEGLSASDQFTLTIAPVVTENVVNDIAADNQFVTGTTENDVFAFAGPSSLYSFGETSDGTGVVVWTRSEADTSFDVLFGFETIRFSDRDIALDSVFGSGPDVLDDPNINQYVQGDSDGDRFIIDGNSSDYRFNQTSAEGGVVVWTTDPNDNSFDILYDFEQLVFNDVTYDITAVNTGGDAVIISQTGGGAASGGDTIVVSPDVLGPAANALIEDFSVAEGDRLDLGALLDANFGEATKDDYVRARTENGNTLIEVDPDGAANGVAFEEVATLEGVSAGPVTIVDETNSVEIAIQNA